MEPFFLSVNTWMWKHLIPYNTYVCIIYIIHDTQYLKKNYSLSNPEHEVEHTDGNSVAHLQTGSRCRCRNGAVWCVMPCQTFRMFLLQHVTVLASSWEHIEDLGRMPKPIGSMYGIYANIGGILMVNVTIYSRHGSYGKDFKKKQHRNFEDVNPN